MQVINYSLQRREHSWLSVVLDGVAQPGEYQKPGELHSISLDRVRLGSSIADITRNATVLLFTVDTISRGAFIFAVVGTITSKEFELIANRSGSNVFHDLLIQFPELLKNN